MKSSTVSVIAIVLLILGFIGGIILGNNMGVASEIIYGKKSFNWIVAISTWIGCFITIFPWFILAQILENQRKLLSEQFNSAEKIRKIEDKIK